MYLACCSSKLSISDDDTNSYKTRHCHHLSVSAFFDTEPSVHNNTQIESTGMSSAIDFCNFSIIIANINLSSSQRYPLRWKIYFTFNNFLDAHDKIFLSLAQWNLLNVSFSRLIHLALYSKKFLTCSSPYHCNWRFFHLIQISIPLNIIRYCTRVASHSVTNKLKNRLIVWCKPAKISLYLSMFQSLFSLSFFSLSPSALSQFSTNLIFYVYLFYNLERFALISTLLLFLLYPLSEHVHPRLLHVKYFFAYFSPGENFT